MRWIRRIAYLFRRSRHDADLREEIEVHRLHRQAHLERNGLSSADASMASRREMGNTLLAREDVNEVWLGPWTGWQDAVTQFRRSASRLVRTPAFSIPALVALGVAVGANISAFHLINSYILAPPPVARPSELVVVLTTDTATPGLLEMSRLNFEDLRSHSRTLSELAASRPVSVTAAVGEQPVRVEAALVTANYFRMLGPRPLRGRVFTDADDQRPGGSPLVIVSEDFWRTQLNGADAALGQTVTINRHPFTVVGVMPANFSGVNVRERYNLWIPISMYQQVETDTGWYTARRALFLTVVGRIAKSGSLQQVRDEVRGIAGRLAAEYPADNKGRGLQVEPLTEWRLNADGRNSLVRAVTIVSLATLLLLLLAYANIGLQLIARVMSRAKETAIQQAVGAAPGRIHREWAIEVTLLFSAALILGLCVSWAFTVVFAAVLPVPDRLAPAVDVRVVGFSFALIIVSVLVCSTLLALQTRRVKLVPALKDVDVIGRSRSDVDLKRVLVFTEIVVSIVPLVLAGLLVRSLVNIWRVDPGFRTDNILMLTLDLGAAQYDADRGQRFYERVREVAAALPGVTDATIVRHRPLTLGVRRTVFVEGATADPAAMSLIRTNVVGDHYFDLMAIAVRGRTFGSQDTDTSPAVVVINRRLAEQLWPGQDAIGKRLQLFGDNGFRQVVGVAANTKINSLTEPDLPLLFLPLRQFYVPTVSLLLRGAQDAYASHLQGLIRDMDPAVQTYDATTLNDHMARTMVEPTRIAALLVVLGALGLVTAATGVYGLATALLSYRRRELGIRMALGATTEHIVRMVLREGLTTFILAAIVGSALAWMASSVVGQLLFEVTSTDPATYVLILASLGLISLGALLTPTWRACRIDPSGTLRSA